MTCKLLFAFCCIFGLSAMCAAQARTITNDDLDSYRQQRVAAQRDLKENYAKLGFASPEEMEKRNAESQRVATELSDRLRSERLERERIEADRQAAMAQAVTAALLYNAMTKPTPQPAPEMGYYSDGWGYGGFGGLGGYGTRRVWRGGISQDGYYTPGGFWPWGSRTTTQPMVVVPQVKLPH